MPVNFKTFMYFAIALLHGCEPSNSKLKDCWEVTSESPQGLVKINADMLVIREGQYVLPSLVCDANRIDIQNLSDSSARFISQKFNGVSKNTPPAYIAIRGNFSISNLRALADGKYIGNLAAIKPVSGDPVAPEILIAHLRR